MSWLVEHVAWILTVRVCGTDGITAYHRIKGKEYVKRSVGFGETIQFKLPSNGPTRKEDGSLAARWLHGVVLGYSRSSHEYWVWYEKGPLLVRSIQRVPLNVRWNAEQLGAVASSRHDLHVAPAVQRRLVPDSDLGDLAHGRKLVLKGMPLIKGDFIKFGCTEHCPRCEDSEQRGWGSTSKAHNDACRARMETELAKTTDGRRRLDLHAKQEARWVPEGAVPAEGGIELEARESIPPRNPTKSA